MSTGGRPPPAPGIGVHRSARYSTICGVTAEEMDYYFAEHLEAHMHSTNQTGINDSFTDLDSLKTTIIGWYDGYSWDGKNRLLNPFSLMNLLENHNFRNYFITGAADTSYLIDLLKKHGVPSDLLRDKNNISDEFSAEEIGEFKPIPVMFQMGYLTVAEILFDSQNSLYKLCIPNQEIRTSLFSNLLENLFSTNANNLQTSAQDLRDALIRIDSSGAEKAFSALLSHVPYSLHIPVEQYYHTVFFLSLKMIGLPLEIEETVGGGIIDAVFEISDRDIFIIEMKHVKLPDRNKNSGRSTFSKAVKSPAWYAKALDKEAMEALKQIENKNYYGKYIGRGKIVWKIAIAVCDRTRVRVVFDKAEPDR